MSAPARLAAYLRPEMDNRRALTIHQPWATLIARGLKDVENRTWATPWRGTLFIHAGKKWDREAAPLLKALGLWPDDLPDSPEAFPTMCLIAKTTLVTCTRISASPWFAGDPKIAWVLADTTPIPHESMPGAQGLWIVGNQKRRKTP